jgi:pimeloyl-ACP methyl ester carboxylesterase
MRLHIWAAALAVCVAAGPATAQAPGAIPSAIYTTPARLIDIGGGRRLNLFCQGHGPVVLMETGFSDTTMTWRNVQAQIATFATACSYDRAGLGFSDAADHPADLVNNAKDLERLIKAAGFDEPVLVGHSLGGLYVGYYARTHPGQVAGLVLVDPSIFSPRALFAKLLGPEAMAKRDAARLEQVEHYRHCLDLAKAGQLVPGRAADASCLDDPPLEDPVLHAETDRQLARAQTQAATASEDLSYAGETPTSPRPDEVQWNAAPPLAADLPVILLKRPIAKPAAMDQTVFDGLIADASARQAAQAPTPGGRVTTVANTGHQIQLDQPKAVIDAVREMVERTRR